MRFRARTCAYWSLCARAPDQAHSRARACMFASHHIKMRMQASIERPKRCFPGLKRHIACTRQQLSRGCTPGSATRKRYP
eukprot:6175299-Pleurochrysis_carterae.AAC.1